VIQVTSNIIINVTDAVKVAKNAKHSINVSNVITPNKYLLMENVLTNLINSNLSFNVQMAQIQVFSLVVRETNTVLKALVQNVVQSSLIVYNVKMDTHH
jgi:hypothetical protein